MLVTDISTSSAGAIFRVKSTMRTRTSTLYLKKGAMKVGTVYFKKLSELGNGTISSFFE